MAVFAREGLTYFPREEVRPELRATSPEDVRQADCEGSPVGPSCSEQGHPCGTLPEERAPELQDLPTLSERRFS